jgi:murein DD-endopeptidase MepM/ murein hydrolase activator NlpD
MLPAAACDGCAMRRLALLLVLQFAAASGWAWPVAPPYAVVRPFVAPPTPYAAGHRGVDLRAPDGAVYAPAPGIVHFAGVVVDRPVLSIRHAGGLLSSYEPVRTDLVEGDTVRRGDRIGTVLPGHCAAVCLHFGVRLDGEYVSPMLLLGDLPRSVLLPTRRGRVGPARAPCVLRVRPGGAPCGRSP